MDIVLNNISKSFNGKVVLDDFSTVLKDKSFNYIMGESGSGKTTLLNIIMGFEKPDKGFINGIENRKISVVFQEDRLCEEFNAVTNIKLVTDKKKAEITNEFKRVGLGGDLNKPVLNLSGGMRRRVAIVRAMMAESDIVILDEPLKGLDDETKKTVIEYIKSFVKNKLVIMVTHDKDETLFAEGSILKM